MNGLKRFCLLVGTLVAIALMPSVSAHAFGATDIDHDGYITFYDLKPEQRNDLRSGYTAGLRGGGHGYEMSYVMSNPYIKDVYMERYANRHSLSYSRAASRTKSYYYHIRNDRRRYPNDTMRWYVTEITREQDGEDAAIVNCTFPHYELTTPETVYYNGKRYKVVGIELTNGYLEKLTITDNIKYIYKCQCPMLKEISGGINVEKIGNYAFKDNLYMTNLPYFPKLTSIGRMAFMGCFYLTEVLLPPNISSMFRDAFGWYDVIKGNYDLDTLVDPDEGFYDDTYADKYKIVGITLYYMEGSKTAETIEEIYGSFEYCFLELKYKDKYPGMQPPVEIEDEEGLYTEWVIPDDELPPEEWVRRGNELPTEPKEIENSINPSQKETMKWLTELYVCEEIDSDTYFTLIGSMCGMCSVPMYFLEKYKDDINLPGLLESTKPYINLLRQKKEALLNKNFELAEKLEKIQNVGAQRLLAWGIQYGPVAAEIKGIAGDTVSAPILVAVTFHDSITGDHSWRDSLYDTVTRLKNVKDQLSDANTTVGYFEACLYVCATNSKAKKTVSENEGSWTNFMNDLIFTSFFDAWLNSYRCSDGEKWTKFTAVYKANIQAVLTEKIGEFDSKYGDDIVRYARIYQIVTSSEFLQYAMNSFIELIQDGTLFSTMTDQAYSMVVDYMPDFFRDIFPDYVASYFLDDPDWDTEDQNITMGNRGTERK